MSQHLAAWPARFDPLAFGDRARPRRIGGRVALLLALAGHVLVAITALIIAHPPAPATTEAPTSIKLNLSNLDLPEADQPQPEAVAPPSQTAIQPATDKAPASSTDVPDFAPKAPATTGGGEPDWDSFVPQFKLGSLPFSPDATLKQRIKYPELAEKAGIKGSVFVELFVDADGLVRRVVVLKEDPKDKGFAEAVVKGFTGFKFDRPAVSKETGQAAMARFRYLNKFN